MATTTKKETKHGSAGKRRAPAKQKAAAGRPSAQKGNPPIRREVGAVLCLFLAFFSFLGCFHVQALFINFFCNLIRGLLGYGFYLVPLALLFASVILLFHRGRPVRARVACALLLPVPLGSLLHLIFCRVPYPLSFEMIGDLYASGLTGGSGGALSGTLAILFAKGFSQIGSGVIFVVLVLFMALVAANRTASDVLDFLKNRPRPVPYEEEPEAEPVSGRTSGKRPRQTVVIDLPVDDPPLAPPMPMLEDKKRKSWFRPGGKPAPDVVLQRQAAMDGEDQATRLAQTQTDRRVSSAASDTPLHAAGDPPWETLAPQPVTGVQKPAESPPVSLDPALQRVKPEEAQRAAAEVAKHIETTMDQQNTLYQYPPVSLLSEGRRENMEGTQAELLRNKARLEDTIQSFGIDARITNVVRGPSVTRYELELDRGVKLNKLTNLADDIALSLGASGVRIAPIPNKNSVVGVEVPNQLVQTVNIHEVIDSSNFRNHPSKVAFAIGKDIAGETIVGNIGKLPHLLIAGTTGSGKSVCMNSIIVSLLYKATPEEVRLIMIDPKMIELGIYNGIPHLLIPVVTDPKKAAGALQWAVTEMMKRYRLFSELNVRDIASYNAAAAKDPERQKLPQIVIVIDELADLMLVAAKDVEESVCRIAQMARAAGMHLIIATQRPSADVITGIMKANIPSRIAFAVASAMESRIILDTQGAEKLVGRGDMLYFPLGAGKPTRVQGCMITGDEVERVAEFVKQYGKAEYAEDVMYEIDRNAESKDKGGSNYHQDSIDEGDELLPAAIDVVVDTGQASVSMLQRRLKLGYSRAARLVDQMEERGIVGPFEGSKPRQLLITKEQWQEMQMRNSLVIVARDEASPSSLPEEQEKEKACSEEAFAADSQDPKP
ncbi:MAG: DNA translocase FtsK [Oscillospiraceae bacterium]|jgi:S-DNA-T family DNA segregation ATPase FtsK/SpoIIIE